MSEGIDLEDNYDGVDYNDYKFDEALRKLESSSNPNRPLRGERQRVGELGSGMVGGGPSPDHADQLLCGCVCALMLILVWFLVLIFH